MEAIREKAILKIFYKEVESVDIQNSIIYIFKDTKAEKSPEGWNLVYKGEKIEKFNYLFNSTLNSILETETAKKSFRNFGKRFNHK